MAVQERDRRPRRQILSDQELATVSAICNRVSRMLGLLDREGLQEDIAIVQSKAPLDLDALLSAKDADFIEELLTIVDATDRVTGSLKGCYRSRFSVEEFADHGD